MVQVITNSHFKYFLSKGILCILLIIGTHVLHGKEIKAVNGSKIYAVFYGPTDNLPYPYTLEEWPEEAKQGIVEALGILNETLILNKEMTIGFMWSDDVDTDHAIALSYNDYIELQHMPDCQLDANYQYPRELLNQLAGNDNYGGENISMIFNSLKDWCFTMDAEPLSDQQDLITVTLHELSHGLGMSSSFTKSNEREPYIFDKYIADSNNHFALDTDYYANDAARKVLLTSDNVYYIGAEGMKANGGKPLRLYAPSVLTGASLCHLDTEYVNDEKGELMIAGTLYGRSTRYLGSYVMGILKDVGWTIQTDAPDEPSANEAIGGTEEDGIKVYSGNKILFVEVAGKENLSIRIYSLSGKLIIDSVISGSGTFPLANQDIYIVKIDNKTYKIRI